MYDTSMESLAVIVPCFNSSQYISELILRLSKLQVFRDDGFADFTQADRGNMYAKLSGFNNSQNVVIFIDDGSTDNTFEMIQELSSKSTLEYILVRTDNYGKTAAVKKAISLAKTTHCIILDSDLELDPAHIDIFWSLVLSKKSNYILGYRKFMSHTSYSYYYTLGNKFISNLFGLLFNKLVTDVMCGYKLMPTDFLANIKTKNKDFGIEILILLGLWKASITPHELEVQYTPRSRAQGKSISVYHGTKIIGSILLYRAINFRSRNKHSFIYKY